MSALKALTGAVILAVLTTAAAGAAFPKPRGRINDFAGVLDAATQAELNRLVRDAEAKTSAEIAVVTVSSLDGMSVEEYAVRLFADWGIGKDAKDNGVLVLVATRERRMRIEVGYGLEPILPDALAGRIIRQEFLPAFRDNDYPRGILKGVARIADIVVRRETIPESERRAARDNRMPVFFALPFLGIFVAIGSFMAGLGMGTRTAVPVVLGLVFAAVGLVIGLATYPVLTVAVLVPIGALTAFTGRRAGASPRWTGMMRGSPDPVSDSTVWIAAAGVTSSDGGSSSSGGDFSGGGDFGGGDSGGGGASGSW